MSGYQGSVTRAVVFLFAAVLGLAGIAHAVPMMVSQNQNTMYAVDSEGGLWLWGNATATLTGEVGDDDVTNDSNYYPTLVDTLPPIVDAGGAARYTALDVNGNLWNGFRDTGWVLDPEPGPWGQVQGGHGGTWAIKADGSLWMRGSSNIEMGPDSINTNTFSPFLAEPGPWTDISSTDNHTLAIKADGTLWGWGYNTRGQLALGSGVNPVYDPLMVADQGPWKAVSISGYYCGAGLKVDGSLWIWGDDIRMYARNFTPVLADAGPYVDLASTTTGLIAAKEDGSVWGLGNFHYDVNGDGIIDPGYRPNSDTAAAPLEIFPPGTVEARRGVVAAHAYNTFSVLDKSGEVWAWGDIQFGKMGNGFSEHVFDPVELGAAEGWTEVDSGSGTIIARKADGIFEAVGDGSYLGVGSALFGKKLTSFTDMSWPQFTSLDAGTYNYVGIDSDGNLWSWGRWDIFSHNGDSNTEPQMVADNTGGRWILAKVGDRDAYAIREDGTLWVAGANYYGQLGTGTSGTRVPLTQIDGTLDPDPTQPWVDVYPHAGFAIAKKADGSFYAAGQNEGGKQGDGTTLNSTLFTLTFFGQTFDKLALFSNGGFGLTSTGEVYGWGSSYSLLPSGPHLSPVLLYSGPYTDIVTAGLGYGAVSMIMGGNGSDAGTLWSYGNGVDAGLGADAASVVTVPTQVGTGSNWVSFADSAPNASQTVVSTTDGRLWGFGNTASGTLGYSNPQFIPATVDPSHGTGGERSFDFTPPVVVITPSSGYFNGPYDVDVAALDNSDDTPAVYCSIDGGPYTLYSGTFTFSSSVNVSCYATDLAGNTSSPVSASLVFDDVAPTVQVLPAATDHANSVEISITAADNVAVSELLYTTDGSDPSVNGTAYVAPFTLNDNATVSYYASDPAGNSTSGSTAYNVNLPPVVDPLADLTVKKNSELLFTVTAADPDLDTLTFSVAQQGTLGTATVDPATGATAYDAGNVTGIDSVTIRVTDNGYGLLYDEVTVNIIVVKGKGKIK